MTRTATVERSTSESTIKVTLTSTAPAARDRHRRWLYDHMLTALSKHSLIDLTVEATGDLHIDDHHTVEDVAICIGQALKEALGDKVGIRRYGHAVVPLDEAVAAVVVDVAGRPYVTCKGEPDGQAYALIGGTGVPYAGSMTYHVFEALALNAGLCLHLTLLSGRDPHHIVEAEFKALARRSARRSRLTSSAGHPQHQGRTLIRRVGLFDYGSGNLHSAARAFQSAGADVVVTGELAELRRLDALVVPGVGAFAACMAGLRRAGGDDLIREWAAAERPLIGICVGHQVLFEHGTEHGVSTPGLGLFSGEVVGLDAVRLPHMGWNTVDAPTDSRLFQGLAGERFYFVHSYAATSGPSDAALSLAEHEGGRFLAAVERGTVASTQFHPEKSGAAGARLIANWLGSAA